jgi:hypothetical protein
MSSPAALRQVRDLAVWEDAGGLTHVLACDVNAAIGERPADHLRADPEEAGYNAAKVALMEVLAAGAAPFLVVDTLCLVRDAYGERVIEGVRTAMAEAAPDALLIGSDETNMPTRQTGVGVVVIWSVETTGLLVGTSHPGALVVCVGMPKDGLAAPYAEGDADVAGLADLLAVRRSGLCQELLPVGSRGIGHELAELAATSGLVAQRLPHDLDAAASAGASTCFLASIDDSRVDDLRQNTRLPLTPVGRLHRADDEERA